MKDSMQVGIFFCLMYSSMNDVSGMLPYVIGMLVHPLNFLEHSLDTEASMADNTKQSKLILSASQSQPAKQSYVCK